MSIEHEVKDEAKWKAKHRRKVEEFVEMLRSKEMSVEVNPAAVTQTKEATLDTKAVRKGPLVKPKISKAQHLLRLFYSR